MGIAENLNSINNSLPDSVKLIAVSKFNPAEKVIEAIKAGQTVFGENRIQEAAPKFDLIRSQGYEAELHIIGSLQRNKVKEAVRIATMIQSADRLELIEEIEKQCSKINKKIQILFEMHTGEESKSGFTSIEEVFNILKMFEQGAFPHIEPKGFMTMAPFTDNVELVRNSFRQLKHIKNKANQLFLSLSLTELSMGMSGDYKTAIEEGSTMVRIGTAIFGARDYSK